MAVDKKVVPYGRQTISDEDIAGVIKTLKSDFLTTGPAIEHFEKDLCTLTGAKHSIACSNGTTALHLACLALDIRKGSLGVTSANTFLASANCIEFCGGKADFIDIDDTLCLSPEKLEEYCKQVSIPQVAIPVDFAGVPAYLPEIFKLSIKYGFKIIEDASHAIGSTYNYNGREYSCGCCQHSDLAIFSFHPVKSITTGEGGAVLTNSAELADKVRLFRSHGMTKSENLLSKKDGPWYYEMVVLGNNYRITDIQCALGISQLKKLQEFKNRRQEIVKKYNVAFNNNARLIIPPWPADSSPCFHLYPIQFAGGELVRKTVYNQLCGKKIFTQVHYIPVCTQPYYVKKYGFQNGKCPNAEFYYSRCLSLPLFPSMTDDDVAAVSSAVLAAIKE